MYTFKLGIFIEFFFLRAIPNRPLVGQCDCSVVISLMLAAVYNWTVALKKKFKESGSQK